MKNLINRISKTYQILKLANDPIVVDYLNKNQAINSNKNISQSIHHRHIIIQLIPTSVAVSGVFIVMQVLWADRLVKILMIGEIMFLLKLMLRNYSKKRSGKFLIKVKVKKSGF